MDHTKCDALSLPGGPKGLPIVGSMLAFKGPATNLEWAKQYGRIYYVRMGNKNMVYVNTIELVEKYLEGPRGDQFLGRPWGPAAIAQGLLFGCGDNWKSNKRAFLKAMHSQTLAEEMETAVQTELSIMLQELRRQADCERPIKIGDTLLPACANAVSSFLLGQSLPMGSSSREILHGVVKNLEQVDLTSLMVQFSLKYPKLGWYLQKFTWQNPVDIFGTAKRLQDLILEWIGQIRQTPVDTPESPDTPKVEANHHPSDWVSTEEYFKQHVGPSLSENRQRHCVLRRILAQPEFQELEADREKELVQSLVDMFFGGVTSVVSGLEFVLMYLSKHPSEQTLAQREIARVLTAEAEQRSSGGNSKVTQNDVKITWSMRDKMPYTYACVAEALRLGCVTPASLPHVATVDAEIDNFAVPRGTFVLASIYSMHRDPRMYTEPSEYNPHRFLDDQGKFQTPRSYRPFGIGARWCVGEELAKMELFIFTAAILREFTVVSPPGSKRPEDMETHMRVVHRLKDFRCILRENKN
ncbi:hypothetical protein EGW08_017968 [Elysia chlorotica]|uniref:Cytochrome P450 n=1 Tax=Elysia chlorotica TaxID=188477 RepID=A0A433SYA6_ELYCH|nr:hypothetical protein EGW08_017968 [Elysia chlorotica]